MYAEEVVRRMEKRTKHKGPDDCWLWVSTLDSSGYGMLKVNGRYQKAHRLAYEIRHQKKLGNLFCLHHCDTPACVNPKHLYAGTHEDNMRDKMERNPPRGSNNGNAKLTDADIVQIRKRLAKGETGAAIARDYGMTRQAINQIRRGEKWRHNAP